MPHVAAPQPAYPTWTGRFRDQVVIVTGAASGIGAATARRFWAEGASVVLADISEQPLVGAVTELGAARCHGHVTDVSDAEQVEALVDATITRFGRLDVLVNNAGIAITGSIADAGRDDWQRVMAVNAGGVFHGCRAALPHLVRSRGNIVNTASVSGLGADWGMSIYNASKGAVVNLTRALALDFADHGVRVNAVCPTVTLTAMSPGVDEDDDLMALLRTRIPLARIAQPSDVAAAITFLASSDAQFITGVNLPVDGGVTASNGQPRAH